MKARPDFPLLRLQTGTAQDIDEQPRDCFLRIAGTALVMPEQPGLRVLRCAGTSPGIQIHTEIGHHAIGQRQDSGLEELRFADRDRAALKFNVTQVEAGKFASSQTRAIGQQQHGIDAQRPKRRPWGRIGTGDIEHPPHIGRRVDVGLSPMSYHFLLGSRVRSARRDGRVPVTEDLRKDAFQLFAFGRMIARGLRRRPMLKHYPERFSFQGRVHLQEPVEP